ncbi:uncharacterized protein DUF397 [Streptomyces sp. Ag109_O5-1]|uniref:DUF397 domain-containing protein n=1 Tax=Streptomyces sp. Ag109_O5-1 TaxID=1938851 RepID=UPI000F503BE9|nr:DUF397 domain-containing protein [Streptomyces sp. Ag109_O5-1]RPE43586.1 uncharacterized protein DUF397 [Streptomyces sp. Ag109_O5-1]
MTASSTQQWFKSSYSAGSGTECVECAYAGGSTLVRDSKHVDGPILAVQDSAWGVFVSALRRDGLLEHRPSKE